MGGADGMDLVGGQAHDNANAGDHQSSAEVRRLAITHECVAGVGAVPLAEGAAVKRTRSDVGVESGVEDDDGEGGDVPRGEGSDADAMQGLDWYGLLVQEGDVGGGGVAPGGGVTLGQEGDVPRGEGGGDMPTEVGGEGVTLGQGGSDADAMQGGPQQPITCGRCGMQFDSADLLAVHRWADDTRGGESACSREKPHVCETCGKAFAYEGHLTQHMLVHSGEKPHVCETDNTAAAGAAIRVPEDFWR
ncbi:hypothetical protein T484DRAFT_1896887 [Baffinella frigidus]|nr:hypothetical protein T484DRAFT_1896887 [Cryptophyta sp. CCMP2293]